MTWGVPDPWPFVLLALAAYRLFRLLGRDAILDPIRDRLVPPDSKRDEFVSCPYCLGAWSSIGWWLAWVAWPHWALVVATPFAISAAVALVTVNLDADD